LKLICNTVKKIVNAYKLRYSKRRSLVYPKAVKIRKNR